MTTLENQRLRIRFDDRGRLVELTNRRSGHNYAGGQPVWRIYLQTGSALDVEVDAAECGLEGSQDGSEIVLRYDVGTREKVPLKITVTVRVRLDEDATRWIMEVRNDEPDVVVRECHFPLVGNLQLKNGQAFIWSNWGGERFADVRGTLHREKLYFGCDHVFTDMSIGYPGSTAATNCYQFCDGEEGLYVGCHDDSAELTQHQVRLYGDALECGMVRYPHLATGETVETGEFVLSPYTGTWHVAARKYRAWADAWFRPPRPPEWIRRLKGWQRIILKHQYGEIHYRYHQFPEIYRDGAAAGLNTYLMFGWQKGGMDDNYPDYTPDPDLGGEAALRKGIADAADAGGKVILLQQRPSDRCRRTIAATPRYAAYLKEVNNLREKYTDLLLIGTYRDTEGFMVDSAEVDARAFVSGHRMAVVLTQNDTDRRVARLTVPGYQYISHDGLQGFNVRADDDHAVDVAIERQGLVVVILQKTEPV